MNVSNVHIFFMISSDSSSFQWCYRSMSGGEATSVLPLIVSVKKRKIKVGDPKSHARNTILDFFWCSPEYGEKKYCRAPFPEFPPVANFPSVLRSFFFQHCVMPYMVMSKGFPSLHRRFLGKNLMPMTS